MPTGGLRALSLTALGGAFAIVGALFYVVLAHATPATLSRALADPALAHAAFLSVSTALAASLAALLIAIPAAYALARYPFRGRMLVDLVVDLPIVLSPVALGICLLLLLRTSPGRWVEENLVTFIFEVPGIILAQFVVALSLSIRVLKAAFEEVDERLEQVARFLGSTQWEAFYRVTLPIASRNILAAFILAFARSIGEFGATVTLAGAVAGKTETMPVAIYMRLAAFDLEGAVVLMALLTLIGLVTLLALRLAGRSR